MKNPFRKGDTKTYRHTVGEADLATFESGTVHRVYATFALGRDAEWACRLFVLDMKEEHEEGMGVSLTVEHLSPAFPGEEVAITATLEEVAGNKVTCSYTAEANGRTVAKGVQVQKILDKQRIASLFASIANRHGQPL